MLVHISKQKKKKTMVLPLLNAMFKINLCLSFLSPGAPHKLEFRLRYVFGFKRREVLFASQKAVFQTFVLLSLIMSAYKVNRRGWKHNCSIKTLEIYCSFTAFCLVLFCLIAIDSAIFLFLLFFAFISAYLLHYYNAYNLYILDIPYFRNFSLGTNLQIQHQQKRKTKNQNMQNENKDV